MPHYVLPLLLISFLLPAAWAKSDPVDFTPVVGSAGKYATTEFLGKMRIGVNVRKEEIKRYKILLVPGFLGDDVNSYLHEYFADEMTAFRWMGLKEGKDFEKMANKDGFDGEASSRRNSVAIGAKILASDRPVILISHSKGSLDCLRALLEHPGLQSHVAGWFSIQGAIAGSPLADAVLESGWQSSVMTKFLRMSDGGINALQDLRKKPRFDYLKDNLDAIKTLTKKIPILSFASWKPRPLMVWYIRGINFLYRSHFGDVPNDGIVETRAEILPYSEVIEGPIVDHADPVLDTGSGADMEFDRIQFAAVMLEMLLSRSH